MAKIFRSTVITILKLLDSIQGVCHCCNHTPLHLKYSLLSHTLVSGRAKPLLTGRPPGKLNVCTEKKMKLPYNYTNHQTKNWHTTPVLFPIPCGGEVLPVLSWGRSMINYIVFTCMKWYLNRLTCCCSTQLFTHKTLSFCSLLDSKVQYIYYVYLCLLFIKAFVKHQAT